MKVDLHCHSTISDGLLPPAELVRRAAANGVELLCLTDHDELSGLADAARAAQQTGVRLLSGVEISVTWRDTTIHIVGVGIDPGDAQLAAGLAHVRSGRQARAVRMAQALDAIGIHGAFEGAARYARNPALIGRTHFARFLVERGVSADVRSVFERYLAYGKPGYVPHQWASLEQAVQWIVAAGGVAVIAHPGRYRLSTRERRRFFEDFQDLGGRGIEVMSGAHNANQCREYARVARHYGFAASCASDFHGPGESETDLGGIQPLPEDLRPVWKDLV